MTRGRPSPAPHTYHEDPAAPGTCVHCHIVAKNASHDPVAVAEHHRQLAEAQHAHTARYDPQDD
jgi:hypothetical protein